MPVFTHCSDTAVPIVVYFVVKSMNTSHQNSNVQYILGYNYVSVMIIFLSSFSIILYVFGVIGADNEKVNYFTCILYS